MRAIDVVALDALARRSFTYVADVAGVNEWREHAEDAALGKPWTGQCASLTATVLQLLWRRDVPLEDLYRIEAVAAPSTVIDHMIGCTWTEEGACLVVGDTFRTAYAAEECPHRSVRYQRMDDLTRWFAGAPWGQP